MAENSKIEWTDHTFNPWEGCTKVSPGCANCYAETRNARFGGGTAPNWGKDAPRRRTSAANWKLPEKWDREAVAIRDGFVNATGLDAPVIRPRVFCASLADWLDPEVPIQWLADLLELIRSTPNLDWLLLTKRPELWHERVEAVVTECVMRQFNQPLHNFLWHWTHRRIAPKNVWIGTTVENQAMADKRIPALLRIPTKVRFLSCEPLLGEVDLSAISTGEGHGLNEAEPIITINPLQRASALDPHIHWVICGGESGPKARPMHPDWARSLRDQCAQAGVPFLFKQWGEWAPAEVYPGGDLGADLRRGTVLHLHAKGNPEGHFSKGDAYVRRLGKKSAGRLLDGREHNEFPGTAERKDGK